MVARTGSSLKLKTKAGSHGAIRWQSSAPILCLWVAAAGSLLPRPVHGGSLTWSLCSGRPPPVGSEVSAVLSEANAERLANALCRMRGAALKLGQMLSIQDENVLPPAFQSALERVRAGARCRPPP